MDTREEAVRQAEEAAEGRRDPMARALVRTLGEHVGVRAVFGAPVERDGVTVIPVGRVRWGFGGGEGGAGGRVAGAEQPEGSGGGGAVSVSPVGYVEISGGRARFRPIGVPVSPGTLLAAAFALGVALRGLRALLR